MSEWEKKCWGRTREVVVSDFYSKHELEVKSGGYCSLHYHNFRANRFIIQTGRVEVVELYGPMVKRFMLGPDNRHDVPSLIPHMFIVYENGTMLEEYYSDRGGEVRTDDIFRIVQGGTLDLKELPSLPFCLDSLRDMVNQ